MADICNVKQCVNAVHIVSLELCDPHYRRLLRNGSVQEEIPLKEVSDKSIRKCQVKSCIRSARAKGYCRTHYDRVRRAGSPLEDLPIKINHKTPSEICEYSDCTLGVWEKRYCFNHYKELINSGIPNLENPDYRYPVLYIGGSKTVDAHRYVWEQANGPLKPGQNIHHKNGDRKDYRISNLEVWDTSQPAGQRIIDKLEWAIEMFDRYDPFALSGITVRDALVTSSVVCYDNSFQFGIFSESDLSWFRVTEQGYLVGRVSSIPLKGRSRLIHRLSWEEHYGVRLLKTQNIHHLNGNRLDNRIDNLELWDTSQPSGQRVSDKINQALQMIEMYQPNLLKCGELV